MQKEKMVSSMNYSKYIRGRTEPWEESIAFGKSRTPLISEKAVSRNEVKGRRRDGQQEK